MTEVRKEIERAMNAAKRTECAMIGVNVRSLNLSNEEKRTLVSKGYNFASGRYNALILNYSQKARGNDLREKVRVIREEREEKRNKETKQ